MFKRISSFILAVVLALSILPMVRAENSFLTSSQLGSEITGNPIADHLLSITNKTPFIDVEPGSFYEIPVAWALAQGITNGISTTEFGSTRACNRAQVVTFLWRAAGCPEPYTDLNPFRDVEKGSFYYKAVTWAVEQGITNGLDAYQFGTNEACNRVQVVTFLWRSMGRPNTKLTTTPFTDVNSGDFYEKAVIWAVENGITNGLSANEFGINAICNRAQIVTFLYRTFEDSSIPIDPAPSKPDPTEPTNPTEPTDPTPTEPEPTEPEPTEPDQPTEPDLDIPPSNPNGEKYVLNLATKKFHYPSCYSVDRIVAENYYEFIGFRDALIAHGYSPCGNCKP